MIANRRLKFLFLSVRSKWQSQFQAMEVRNSQFSAFIDVLTPSTYVLVVMSDPSIREFVDWIAMPKVVFLIQFRTFTESAATQVNIQVARRVFDKLEGSR